MRKAKFGKKSCGLANFGENPWQNLSQIGKDGLKGREGL